MQATFQHMGKPSENAVVENASILMNSTGIPLGCKNRQIVVSSVQGRLHDGRQGSK